MSSGQLDIACIRGKERYKYCSVSRTDRSFHAAGFNLVSSVYVLFSLKAVEPIDLHYMTDRLQRFELEVLVCVLQK